MKLVHPLLSEPICFSENSIPVLVLENPAAFRRITSELIRQSEGESGDFILSINDKPVECADHMNVFFDYAHLDSVEKRIQTKALNSFIRSTQETMADETYRLSLAIKEYLAKLATLSDHPVSYEQGENLIALLKAMEFRVDLAGLSPCEALYEQIVLVHSLSKWQCFVLINAYSFFTAEELAQLYKMAQYQKISLMLLENHASKYRNGCEKVILFDEDMCELRLDFEGETD